MAAERALEGHMVIWAPDIAGNRKSTDPMRALKQVRAQNVPCHERSMITVERILEVY